MRKFCIISCGGVIKSPLARCLTPSAVKKLSWLSNPRNLARQRAWERNHPCRKTPENRLKSNVRVRLWRALNGKSKSDSTRRLVGCDIRKLRAHLEAQFKPGMSWDNYGQWHVDHKRPCASFDLSKPEEQRACFHYTNLQPLWAHENLTKSDTVVTI